MSIVLVHSPVPQSRDQELFYQKEPQIQAEEPFHHDEDKHQLNQLEPSMRIEKVSSEKYCHKLHSNQNLRSESKKFKYVIFKIKLSVLI